MASIRERNGSYQITVSCGRNIDGHKIRETITYTPDPKLTPKKRQKAVEDYARQFEEQVRNGVAQDGRKTTLKEFADRWLVEYGEQKLELTTLEDYTAELNGKILPELGHYKLSELKPQILNSFFVSLSKDGIRKDGKSGGYSKATIKKTQDVLSSVLRTAIDWEIIDKNPCDKVRIEAEDVAEKIKFFTPQETAIFLNYIERPYVVRTAGHKRIDDTGKEYVVGTYESTKEISEQLRILFNLAVYTGLRKGEIIALTWDDIDFELDTITIQKSAAVVNSGQIVKRTKSKKSNREISIPHSLTVRLQKLQKEQQAYRKLLGSHWKGQNWIFIQDNGKQMNYSTPYQAFQKAIKRYNTDKAPKDQLPMIPFHGLRHTSATLLIAGREDISTVSSRLGHAQTSTTMNIYVHALKESDRKASNTLEKLIDEHK